MDIRVAPKATFGTVPKFDMRIKEEDEGLGWSCLDSMTL